MPDDGVKPLIPATRMCMAGDIGQLRVLSAIPGPPFFSDTPSTAQVVPPPDAVAAANEAIALHPENFPKDSGGRIGVGVSDPGDNLRAKPRVEYYPKACPAPITS